MSRTAYQSKVRDWLALIDKSPKDFIGQMIAGMVRAYGVSPGESEIRSWGNSLCKSFAPVLREADVPDALVFFEFGMPLQSERCDALIVGSNEGRSRCLLFEFKQWNKADLGPYAHTVLIGGRVHYEPCRQAGNYVDYLGDTHPFFRDGNTFGICFLHAMEKAPEGICTDPRVRVFFQNDRAALVDLIHKHLPLGALGNDSESILKAEYEPNPTLLGSAAVAIREAKTPEGKPVWNLMPGQSITVEAVAKAVADNQKRLIIQLGPPGTGKSIIAMWLLAEAAANGKRVNHVSGLKAFRNTLGGSIVGAKGLNATRAKTIFKLFHSYVNTQTEILDLAVCDEAHRARMKTSLRPYIVSNEPQAVQVIRSSRVTVALLDDRQILRTGEDGTVENWISWGLQAGLAKDDIEVLDPLKAVFRANGSERYTEWVDDLLYNNPSILDSSLFEFQTFKTPQTLENFLVEKMPLAKTARFVAGFCWPWSDTVREQPLALDVQIGDWQRAWNANVPKGDAEPAWDIHPYTLWATRKNNPLSEIGCIHSAQGFEFDYVGIIWGNDLVRRDDAWVAQPQESHDNDIRTYRTRGDRSKCLTLLKNSYRVLLTRGLRGSGVFFTDNETRDFVCSKLQGK